MLLINNYLIFNGARSLSLSIKLHFMQFISILTERTLGQGTFGKVKLGYHTITDEYVAIKVLEKNRIENQFDLIRVQREITILRKVNHPNVIKLYEILESEQSVYLVMEYVRGGELYEYIIKKKYLPEHIAARFFQQIIFAIEYLYNNNITHRDLKPENLLLDDNKQLKIADFGLSFISFTQGELLKTACGSPCYAAPEMLIGKQYEGWKSDIWSSGIVLYAMLCGYLPFEHENTKELYQLIRTSDFEKPEHLSPNAIDMLTKILVKDPNKRLNFEQIKQHPFFLMQAPLQRKNLKLDDQIIIQKMIEMGYSQNQITFQLKANKHNTLTTIYFLLQKKQNQPYRKNFFQNIQNIANMKIDLNQKKQTFAKIQPSQQGSPNFDKLDVGQQRMRQKMNYSPYLQTQVSQKFKKLNLSVQSKRVSIQIDNTRQKTYSVQEKYTDYPQFINQTLQDSKFQTIRNQKQQGNIKFQPKKDIEHGLKTDINEEITNYFKGNLTQVRQRNKTQPNKNVEALKFFDKNSKLQASNQIVSKTPQNYGIGQIELSKTRQLQKQQIENKYSVINKKRIELKIQKQLGNQF
ncbi:unnamed protein product [Paramecium sonneborni]|uniref:non-specific serine/threonine protein kinase n=1 Tax=Paramecium sonneborni TaxID=65129 RepID=A0A8S1NBP6_9CILI|nr:unnamed protein product [Paramecium sonneborni]